MSKSIFMSVVLAGMLLGAGAAARAANPELQTFQQRLSALSQGQAAQAAPQALAEARAALEAMGKAAPGSPEYTLQKDRFESKSREAELLAQAAEDAGRVQVLTQRRDALLGELQQLQARRAELQDRIARRRQEMAQRLELNEEIERQRRARLEAESRLAQLALEKQRMEAGLNALLSRVAQVQDDSEGKHLRLDGAALFRGRQMTAAGQRQVQSLVALVRALPDRRYTVRVAPEQPGTEAVAEARAQALAQALIKYGLPADVVDSAVEAGLPVGQVEVLMRSAPGAGGT
ncbi:MAG: hypothetical protein ACOY4L_03745 [Pseudomonadota bacterium]